MIRRTQNTLAALFGRLSGSHSENPSRLGTLKNTRRRTERRGRFVSPEQLESRQLLTGLSFESVITTERNYPVGASFAQAVATDVAGNTYLGGNFQGTVDFDRNAVRSGNEDILTARGYGDVFVAKYDSSGQFLWARRMGGDSANSSDDLGYGIETDDSGNVFLTGIFGETADFGGTSLASVGLKDSFLTKLDPNGNFLWTAGLGTEIDDRTSDIVVDGRGSVTVATTSSTLGSGQPATTRIRQFDENGTQSWVYQIENGVGLYSDTNGDLYLAGRFKGTVDLDAGPGEYVVTGSTTVNNSFISKLSSNGQFLWGTTIEWDPSVDSASNALMNGMAIGHDGSIAFIGSYSGQVRIDQGSSTFALPSSQITRTYFATLNSSTGAFQSANVYDGFFASRSLIAIDNGYAVSGMTEGINFNPVPGVSLTTWGSNDVFLMTLDKVGVVTWTGLVGGTSIDIGGDLKSDGKGGLLLPGYSVSTVVDFDPSPLRSNAVSNVGSFVVKLKPMLPTQFYVVDDASINRTYEYAADHSSVENYWLNGGNSAPRGAASTAAGDKVWVVDANRNVYIYNNSGSLLGSWTAGSVASNATIEGITTNGTDVWLVDARQDRVYRYANAASRLSGSQNAASNFALNSSNTSPKDLVTDGTNLWVVNDATSDKVFKYTLTGSLVGSWTIDSGNKAPTGLTIDPSGASQSIWIVDNGTDRVYEYTSSRSRNSGSQLATATFTLAAGNTNPQGIADPPARTSASTSPALSPSHGSTNVDSVPAAPPASRVSGAGRRIEFREAISSQKLPGTLTANITSDGTGRFEIPDALNEDLSASSRATSPQSSALSSLDSYFSDFDQELDESLSNTLQSALAGGLKKRNI
jgi:hypothetical protein